MVKCKVLRPFSNTTYGAFVQGETFEAAPAHARHFEEHGLVKPAWPKVTPAEAPATKPAEAPAVSTVNPGGGGDVKSALDQLESLTKDKPAPKKKPGRPRKASK